MKKCLVLQSDFGLGDGAVSAMVGVAYGVDPELKIHDVTHDITPYNIFEASYRLVQTAEYWPVGTVFVSVVDPGVGSNRQSVVALLNNGQYIVTPNNGTLTHLHHKFGVKQMREISEAKHRRANTEESYTFHGRDVYAYTGAKIAAGEISFEEVGPLLPLTDLVEVETGPVTMEDGCISGNIDILDVRFGSLWTNIPLTEFQKLNVNFGEKVEVTIYNGSTMAYQNNILYGKSFADVMIGAPIVYANSLYKMGIAINQGSFARAYNIGVGLHWRVEVRRRSY